MNAMEDVLPYVRLKFNIDNIDLDECYADGYEQALHQKEESDNPFEEGSLEAEHWSQGWWDGFYAHQPLHDIVNEASSAKIAPEPAVNDAHFTYEPILYRILKISGALFASAIIGYQIFDLVG